MSAGSRSGVRAMPKPAEGWRMMVADRAPNRNDPSCLGAALTPPPPPPNPHCRATRPRTPPKPYVQVQPSHCVHTSQSQPQQRRRQRYHELRSRHHGLQPGRPSLPGRVRHGGRPQGIHHRRRTGFGLRRPRRRAQGPRQVSTVGMSIRDEAEPSRVCSHLCPLVDGAGVAPAIAEGFRRRLESGELLSTMVCGAARTFEFLALGWVGSLVFASLPLLLEIGCQVIPRVVSILFEIPERRRLGEAGWDGSCGSYSSMDGLTHGRFRKFSVLAPVVLADMGPCSLRFLFSPRHAA